MSAIPRAGQPRTAAARNLAFPAGGGAREACHMATRRVNGTWKAEAPRVWWTPEAESDLRLVVDDPEHRRWDREQERRESWYPEQADDGPGTM